jgi:hypothetical protein
MTGANTTPMVTVTDGRAVLGFVFERGKTGHEAFTAGQISLGTYPTRVLAANAIADHAADATEE